MKRLNKIWENVTDTFDGNFDISDIMMIGLMILCSPFVLPIIMIGLIPLFILDLFDIARDLIYKYR